MWERKREKTERGREEETKREEERKRGTERGRESKRERERETNCPKNWMACGRGHKTDDKPKHKESK